MVQVVETIAEVRDAHARPRGRGETIGLVPTMGYLHDGHASLMRAARSDTDFVTATIFVNPLQFAPDEDLAAYPRDLEHDLTVAAAAGVDLVFAPGVDEMYPDGPVLTAVSIPTFAAPLEGRSRPTHFDGMATVVAKLFNIAGPCRAYFGEKDFQQLAIIRRMVHDLSVPVEVVGCPIVREADGLAMSSRNVYLTAEERAVAPTLKKALDAGRELVEAGERSPDRVVTAMTKVTDLEPRVVLDYAEVVDVTTLGRPTELSGELRLLIAAQLGKARLIDNVGAFARPADA